MSREVTNVSEWLVGNGMTRKWADSVAIQVKKEYPALGQAMRNQVSNRAELELIQLIHHVMQGRFPVKAGAKALRSPV